MYRSEVVTKEQALAHLFFHCCFRDELATESEIALIADKIVALKLHDALNLKEEVSKYKAYQPAIDSEEAFIQHLQNLLPVQNKLALYSYCVELCLSDLTLHPGEAKLLMLIGNTFGIPSSERETINTVMIQRVVINSGGVF